jgi:hypothetical protein
MILRPRPEAETPIAHPEQFDDLLFMYMYANYSMR